MEKISTKFSQMYFHDGGLDKIYYDKDYQQLFFEIELPEEVDDLGIDYGNSRCGLLTFFGVEESSIKSNADYLTLNHPNYPVDILSGDYLPDESTSTKDAVRFWFWIDAGGGVSVQFTAEGFMWSPDDKCC